MLRKKIAATVAAALMTLSASSAFASFADLELIRVYYDRSGNEYATDLGNVKALTAAGANTTIAGSFGSLSAGSSFAAYFALDRSTGELWASNSTTTTPLINGTSVGLTTLKSGTTNMYSLYNTQGGTTYSGLASASNSYKNKISATQGNLANAINNTYRMGTEASLASVIGTPDGSAAQTLYYWYNGTTTIAQDKIGFSLASITTLADGSTVITSNLNPTTPIPPAFLLMGSGLLGMVGLRRKNKVA